jgi:hypothetical protein
MGYMGEIILQSVNHLKPSGYSTYPLLSHTNTLHSAYTICDSYCSHNKQRLLPRTALTGWSLYRRRDVFPVRYELKLFIYYLELIQSLKG